MNDCCTDGLKNRLIAIPDYESTVRDDPLALLTAIKTCVHENTCTQHPPVTISTHWDCLLDLKQAEEEDPPSCAKRFEQQLKTVKGYIGSTFTDGFTEQMPEHKAHACKHDAGKIAALLDTHVADVDAREALADDLIDLLSHYKPKETQTQLDVKAQARSEFETYLFLRSVHKAKCGSLLTTLQTQHSLGKEQYPDAIHKAVDILSQHRWDQNPSNQRKPNGDSRNSNSNNHSSGNDNRNKCNRDQNHSHLNNNSSNESRPDSSSTSAPSFAQQGRRNSGGQSQSHSQAICHACVEMGHIHPDCDKDVPRDRWFINRAFMAIQNIGQEAPPSHVTTHSDNVSTGSRHSQQSSTPASNHRSDRPDDLSCQGLQFFNTMDEPCKPQSIFGFSQAPPPTCLSDVFLSDSGSGIDGTVYNPDLI